MCRADELDAAADALIAGDVEIAALTAPDDDPTDPRRRARPGDGELATSDVLTVR